MVVAGYNHVALLGSVQAGPWRNAPAEGKAQMCAFTLAIPELGKNEQIYKTFVRIECYGRTIEQATTLQRGDVILVVGKLAWQKGKSDKAGLGVVAWRIVKLSSVNPTVE